MIYIDYITTKKISNQIALFSGGENFVRHLLMQIKKNRNNIKKTTIILPKDIADISEDDKIIFNGYRIVFSDTLDSYPYEKNSILFLPQVNGTLLRELKKIKKNNTSLKIYGMLHDRQHNYFKYDPYDSYYIKGNIIKKIIEKYKFKIKIIYFNLNYSKWVNNLDKVFTDSNYSMQVLNNKNIKDIRYFYQGSILESEISFNETFDFLEKYALFVSGARPEKNLLRTLEGYEIFLKKYPSKQIKIYITGIDDTFLKSFLRSGKIHQNTLKNIKAFGYIPYTELVSLYRNCNFVVFTSKAEGFGLPVLEALMRGKPVLASSQTSIPEVGGAILKYVNAYDANSIAEGFRYMCEIENIKYIKSLIPEKLKIIKQQIDLDLKVLIHELFS